MNGHRNGEARDNGERVAHAIGEVLRLQEQSRVTLALTREEAERLLLDARENARRIQARADRRIGRIQKEHGAQVRKRVEALVRKERLKAERERHDTPRPDVAALARQLAQRLTDPGTGEAQA